MSDNPGQIDFSMLADHDRLARVLAKDLVGQSPRSIAVGVHTPERSAIVVLRTPGAVLASDASLILPSACATQLFTATLVMIAANDGRLSLDDKVSAILPVASRAPLFKQVKVRQLLNHTHGFDDSNLGDIPRNADGRIDAEFLCSRLGSTLPLAEPGQMYTYGRAGPYLAGAILEKLFDQPFAHVLGQRLFDPLGLTLHRDDEGGGMICPANGGSLCVSTKDLLKFLRWHLLPARVALLNERSLSQMPAMYENVASICGWLLERGSALGWRWYGEHWFGHVGFSVHGSTVVRIEIERRIGLVVQASGCNALHATARLFGPILPDFAGRKSPRRLSSDEAARLDFDRYVGIYQNASVTIQIIHDGPLRMTAFMYVKGQDAALGEPVWSGALQPAGDGLFLTEAPPDGYNYFSNFSHLSSKGYIFFQNGPNLLRRTDRC